MASRFFLSIPSAILVQEPYDEVFSLFTTETGDALWEHNRSVSQQTSQLEVELDFTPITSPATSLPGSRPVSRSESHLSPAPSTAATLVDEGPGQAPKRESGQDESYFPPTSSPIRSTATSPTPGSVTTMNDSLPKSKSPVGRALLGSRKPSRTNSSSSTRSMKSASQQPTIKPVVIHQSLSTLSKPGQTGTVVWDSSILMAKFLLSIKSLTMGCYRSHLKEQRALRAMERRIQMEQREKIRMLEEQAEKLSVSPKGDLEAKETPDKASSENQQGSQMTDTDTSEVGDDDDGDDLDTSSDIDDDGTGAEDDMLMFDPAETTILELGSGCGLLGIVMAELCQDLLLTDQKPVLPLLLKNLRKNLDKRHFDRNSASASYGAAGATNASDGTPLNPTTASSPAARRRNDRRDGGGSVKSVNPCYIQVQELVWGEELDQDLRNGIGVDYVVATDVIYNESVVPKLIYTLRELCESRNRARQEYSQGHGSRLDRIQRILSTKYGGGEEGTLERARSRTMKRMLNKTVVLLAQELRTDYVHLTFLEGLQEAGFQIVRMPKGAMDPAYHSGYVIYACFLRG